MKEPFITIFNYDGMGINIYETVAKKFNIVNGQIVSSDILTEILIASAEHDIAICRLELAMAEEFEIV